MPIDTFLAPYHFTSLRKDTVGPIFLAISLFEGRGLHHWVAVMRKSIENLRGQPEAEWGFIKHTAISQYYFYYAGRPCRNVAGISGE